METAYNHMPNVCGFKHYPGTTPDQKGCIKKPNSYGPLPAIDKH